MKSYIVTLAFIGLTGPYESEVCVRARNEASAKKKGAAYIGNRDGHVKAVRVGILERIW